MKTSHILILVVAVVIVAALYMSEPKTPTRVYAPTGAGSSNSSFFNLGAFVGGIFSNSKPSTAPGALPSLQQSHDAAQQAIATGQPVSQTQGNGLMSLGSLDGSSLVSI
jgi:hypothetical protein